MIEYRWFSKMGVHMNPANKLWLEIINDIDKKLFNIVKNSNWNTNKRKGFNTNQVLLSFQAITEVIPELVFTYDANDKKFVVYHRKEHIGHITIDIDKEIMYIENVYYYKEQNEEGKPIKGVTIITFYDLLLQIVELDNTDMKLHLEKAAFKLT